MLLQKKNQSFSEIEHGLAIATRAYIITIWANSLRAKLSFCLWSKELKSSAATHDVASHCASLNLLHFEIVTF